MGLFARAGAAFLEAGFPVFAGDDGLTAGFLPAAEVLTFKVFIRSVYRLGGRRHQADELTPVTAHVRVPGQLRCNCQ